MQVGSMQEHRLLVGRGWEASVLAHELLLTQGAVFSEHRFGKLQ